ncbi:alpha/beta hydrolase [Phyllobacterium sp. OV277]|uniref:alpha/beta fold hydrolase n=1 Tax=Phyllobacterium sp. OV277 TaxID=1882772 RepID=UPI00087FB623|nr:alpha/beta hydrolase [Phyllobacterium sp. OV277]SDP90732.1 Pimeloyl-ACP methyl ester carboxylesterase [Phyllobacterium sp. OV277]
MKSSLRSALVAAAILISPILASPHVVAAEAVNPTNVSAGQVSTVERFSVRSSDGTMLAVEAKGNPAAPEILFIHGLRQSGLSWDKQFDDPTLSGFRLVRFDLRGHGDSGKPEDPESYSDPKLWADDIKAVIDGAKLHRPVLVGWSLGGYVAGAYLNRYGGSHIAGINLVDAVVKLSPDLLTPLAGQFSETATSRDLAVRSKATAEFLASCFNIQPTPEEFDRMLVINGMTARAVNEGFIQTSLTDLLPVFQTYSGPILLTHGVHDRLVRVATSERVRDLHADSKLQLYENSGHSPFFEEPERYGRDLKAFVLSANN